MENDVMELIDSLYTMVTEAWGVPLGKDKCMLERDAALNLLDELKAQLPVELAEAKRLVSARDEYIGNAKREAESIRKNAEEHARVLLDDQEVLRLAKTRSAEMLAHAEKQSKDLRRATNAYVEETIRRTEEAVNTALTQLRQSRERYHAAAQQAAAQEEENHSQGESAEG